MNDDEDDIVELPESPSKTELAEMGLTESPCLPPSNRYDDDPDDITEIINEAESIKMDNFVPKIIVNCLADWAPDDESNFFISEIFDRTRAIRGTWYDDFLRLRKDYIEGRKAAGIETNYIRIGDFITKEHVQKFIENIHETCPSIKADWIIENNTKVLSDILDLSRTEELVLDLGLRLSSDNVPYEYQRILESIRYDQVSDDKHKIYSKLFNVPVADIKEAFNGFLIKSGFLAPHESSSLKHLYVLSDDIAEVFNRPLTLENIEEQLFPSNITTELTTDLYPHLEEEIKITENIINHSLVSKPKGTNLMFWGIPGTGKTEMAMTLAKKNGWNIKVIGDISEIDQKEKSRAERLTSLKIAMKLFKRRDNVVLLFDEMEDLFKDSTDENYSKAFINRIIETTPIPIIWTTNELFTLGAAVLRRMVYNIGFEVPSAKARKTIWSSYNDKYQLDLPEETLDEFSFNYDMVPALIGNAAKIAHMAQLPKDEIPKVLKSLDTLVNYGHKRKFDEATTRKDTPYDLTCLNTDVNVVEFLDNLMEAEPGYSLCFYGPPGTGKSELGRYIAKKLKKRVLFKRGSDLESMWVGQTEKNIAEAFTNAKENEMVLIIDEGDSFLRSREMAKNSWEVTKVNEMLSQMEMHSQPFIMTTNLMKDLDPASLRRFTFKIEFNFLKPDQAAKLFHTYFGGDAPKGILKNDILTPGDYATVLKRAKILHVTDCGKIYDMLMKECDMKPQKTKEIGFSL